MSESEYFGGEVRVLKVAATTKANDLGITIAQLLFTDVHRIALSMIGAAAVNQAVKAVAVARRHMSSAGRDCWFSPAFEEQYTEEHGDTTSIRFLIEERVVQSHQGVL